MRWEEREKVNKIRINFFGIFVLRAFSSGVPNAKYLTFGTPNTNKTSLMRCSKSQKIWHT